MAEPTRVPILEFISPKMRDVIFYEPAKYEEAYKRFDKNSPLFGTAHPEYNKWPNHKLVAIVPESTGEGWVRLYYAATRASQEDYNYEITNLLDKQWPECNQTWVMLRDDVTSTVQSVAAPPAQNHTWTRIGAIEKKTGDKIIDSIFIIFQVFYRDMTTPLPTYGFDPETGILITTTEQQVPNITAPGSPAAGSDISKTALGTGVSLVKTSSLTAATLDAYVNSVPTRCNLSIPDVLESVTIEWAESSAEGTFDSEWEGYKVGNGSLSGSESGNASSSISLIPDLTLDVKQYWARNMPSTTHFFYMARPVTEAQILSRLTTIVGASVARWPVFKPRGHSISLIGGKKSVDVRVSASASASWNDDGAVSYEKNEGQGDSYSVGLTHNVKFLPPMIHRAINFSGLDDRTVEATAVADVGWVGSNFPSVAMHKEGSIEVEGLVSPSSIPATSPSSVPESGYYLIDSKVQPWKYGYMLVMAEVFNATYLAD